MLCFRACIERRALEGWRTFSFETCRLPTCLVSFFLIFRGRHALDKKAFVVTNDRFRDLARSSDSLGASRWHSWYALARPFPGRCCVQECFLTAFALSSGPACFRGFLSFSYSLASLSWLGGTVSAGGVLAV